MGRLMDKELFEQIHSYFTEYLPVYKNAGSNTIQSYRDGINLFLEFLKQTHGVTLSELSFSMITESSLQEYLLYLRGERNFSESTCRQRIACLKAFLKYCSEANPTLAVYYLRSQMMTVKTVPVSYEVEYLSEKAIRVLLQQPDTTTTKGQRDLFFMILLYDTGARVDELLSAKLCDIQTEAPAKILLHGKGRKQRSVPLSERTVHHFEQYIRRFHPDTSAFSDAYIFYTVRGGQFQKMSSDTVQIFMKKYGMSAQKYCSEIPDNLHPHVFRHSRAMHLYQGGMDLTLVSQWLGHANLQTTLVYAHADTEMKRKAIALATGAGNPTCNNPSTKLYTENDEELLRKLYGLK